MKLTSKQLKRIIKEELNKIMNESEVSYMRTKSDPGRSVRARLVRPATRYLGEFMKEAGKEPTDKLVAKYFFSGPNPVEHYIMGLEDKNKKRYLDQLYNDITLEKDMEAALALYKVFNPSEEDDEE